MLDLPHAEAIEDCGAPWTPFPAKRRKDAAVTEPLDTLSLRVVHLAREEAWRSLALQTAAARLMHWLLGDIETPRPLASPRLEMLRIFCTFVVLGDRRSSSIAHSLLEKGHYSNAQLAEASALSLA